MVKWQWFCNQRFVRSVMRLCYFEWNKLLINGKLRNVVTEITKITRWLKVGNSFLSFTDGLGPVACSHSKLILQLWILQAVGKTPWTGDQPIARPLLHRTTQTQKERTHTYIYPCIK
jgi:hypothetical protein